MNGTSARGQYLLWAAVLLALHLVAVALLEPAMNIWPPRTGDPLWRLVFATQFLNGGGNFLTALVLLLVGAWTLRSRLLAMLGVVGGLVTAVGVGALVVFLALDYLQVRSGLAPAAVGEWDRSVLAPVALGGLAVLAYLVVMWAGIGLVRSLRSKRPEPPVVVVNQPT